MATGGQICGPDADRADAVGARLRANAVKAVVCREPGQEWTVGVESVPDRRPENDEIAIAVDACGVNFPDLLIVQGAYQFKPPPPFTPGSEVAGVITDVGPGVEDLSVGDAVMATMLWGGYAERVVVPASAAVRIPIDADRVEASTFLLAYGTSQHALVDRAALAPGESLLVLGAAGGVGLAAVELGAALGARVIAAASSSEKLELCRSHGASETIEYTREDLRERVRDLTSGAGADVVFDPVGGPLSEVALRSTAWEGRFLVVGFASGVIQRVPLNLPLLKGCSIVGVFWGEFRDREVERHQRNMAELVTLWQRGDLTPHVSAVFPLERADRAIAKLSERTVLGKLALTPSGAGR